MAVVLFRQCTLTGLWLAAADLLLQTTLKQQLNVNMCRPVHQAQQHLMVPTISGVLLSGVFADVTGSPVLGWFVW